MPTWSGNRTSGQYEKAEPLFKKVLEIRQKTLGREDYRTLQTLNALAVLYQQMREYDQAEPLFNEALEISKNLLGPEHADTVKWHYRRVTPVQGKPEPEKESWACEEAYPSRCAEPLNDALAHQR